MIFRSDCYLHSTECAFCRHWSNQLLQSTCLQQWHSGGHSGQKYYNSAVFFRAQCLVACIATGPPGSIPEQRIATRSCTPPPPWVPAYCLVQDKCQKFPLSEFWVWGEENKLHCSEELKEGAERVRGDWQLLFSFISKLSLENWISVLRVRYLKGAWWKMWFLPIRSSFPTLKCLVS